MVDIIPWSVWQKREKEKYKYERGNERKLFNDRKKRQKRKKDTNWKIREGKVMRDKDKGRRKEGKNRGEKGKE